MGEGIPCHRWLARVNAPESFPKRLYIALPWLQIHISLCLDERDRLQHRVALHIEDILKLHFLVYLHYNQFPPGKNYLSSPLPKAEALVLSFYIIPKWN
jgi:hypothetical protein